MVFDQEYVSPTGKIIYKTKPTFSLNQDNQSSKPKLNQTYKKKDISLEESQSSVMTEISASSPPRAAIDKVI